MVLFKAPFVNRALGLGFLGEKVSMGSVLPLYVYGPESCCRIRLLKELIGRLRDGGFVAV